MEVKQKRNTEKYNKHNKHNKRGNVLIDFDL